MPSICQPRRPRASPIWQLVHHGWAAFPADCETRDRKHLGPLHPVATATVESFLRYGDLAPGFRRLQCPDCGHESLLAFNCKGRHFCPSCHERRVRSTSDWIATAVCHEVPHSQLVFKIPKFLRGIFRKRRHNTRRNLKTFKAPYFIAAALLHPRNHRRHRLLRRNRKKSREISDMRDLTTERSGCA